MTREEQINLYLKERNIPITSLEANSIIEGIKWADEHPNKDLKKLSRKAESYDKLVSKGFVNIEMVCAWMKEQVYQEYPGGPFERVITDEMIKNFKKIMEEQYG